MSTRAELATAYRAKYGILEFFKGATTFALALADKNLNVILDPNDLPTSRDNLLNSGVDGLNALRVARATFDPTGNSAHRTIAAHTLGVTLPNKAIVVGGFVQVVTVLDSADHSGSVAISIQSANDLITASAISGAPYSTTGAKAIVPKSNTPESTGIILTAARTVTATVTTTALTVGKLVVFLHYVVGG